MDKVVHGLDYPNDIAEKNMETLLKELGITEDDINSFDDGDDND